MKNKYCTNGALPTLFNPFSVQRLVTIVQLGNVQGEPFHAWVTLLKATKAENLPKTLAFVNNHQLKCTSYQMSVMCIACIARFTCVSRVIQSETCTTHLCCTSLFCAGLYNMK